MFEKKAFTVGHKCHHILKLGFRLHITGGQAFTHDIDLCRGDSRLMMMHVVHVLGRLI